MIWKTNRLSIKLRNDYGKWARRENTRLTLVMRRNSKCFSISQYGKERCPLTELGSEVGMGLCEEMGERAKMGVSKQGGGEGGMGTALSQFSDSQKFNNPLSPILHHFLPLFVPISIPISTPIPPTLFHILFPHSIPQYSLTYSLTDFSFLLLTRIMHTHTHACTYTHTYTHTRT